MQLDPIQFEVATAAPQMKQLVLAGPGTGKTEVVAGRLAYLIADEQLAPAEIVVLSFSRTAVRVLSDRLLTKYETDENHLEALRYLTVRTFDSWCYRLLRLYGDEPDELLCNTYDSNIERVVELLGTEPEVFLDAQSINLRRVKHIIVDELQDLNGCRARLTFALLSLLCSSNESPTGFTLLGDPNQAIFDWVEEPGTESAYHSIDLLEEVKMKWASQLSITTLKKNYRSDEVVDNLVKRASHILETVSNAEQAHTELSALLRELPVVSAMPGECSDGFNRAVLCRTNGDALLAASRIPMSNDGRDANVRIAVRAGGHSRVLPAWIAIVLHRYRGKGDLTKALTSKFLDVLQNDGVQLPSGISSENIWQKILNVAQLAPGEGGVSMERFRERVTWLDSLPDDETEASSDIVFTTIHQSKGGEYDEVLLLETTKKSSEDPEQETRVQFVALSRARRKLSLLKPESSTWLSQKKFGRGKRVRWFGSHPIEGNSNKYLFHMELGLQGDLVRESSVDPKVLGSAEAVEKLQAFLAKNVKTIRGCPIELRKRLVSEVPRMVVYEVYLILNDEEILVGLTSDVVREDLYYGIAQKQKGFLTIPSVVSGLRVSEVCSFVGIAELGEQIPAPWSISRVWLGVHFHGVGTYRYWYSRRKKG